MVPLLNGCLALLAIHTIIEGKKSNRLPERSQSTFLYLLFLWLTVSFLQIVPALVSLARCFRITDLGMIIEEAIVLGETHSLYPFQVFFNRTWIVFAIFYFISSIRKEDIKLLLGCLFAGLTLTEFAGIISYFDLFPLDFSFPQHGYGGHERLQSFFGNPGWLAEYIVFLVPLLAASLGIKSISRQERRFVVVLLFWSFVVLYLSYTRTAFLVIVFYILALVLWYVSPLIRKNQKRALWVTCCFSGGLLLVLIVYGPTVVEYNTAILFSKEKQFGSFFSRLFLWKTAWSQFLEYPFLGQGLGMYWHQARDYLEGAHFLVRATHNTAHNTFLNVLAEEGVMGLLLLCSIFFLSLFQAKYCIRTRREGRTTLFVIMSGLYLAIFIYGQFQHLFYVHSVELLLWLAVSLPFANVLSDKTECSGPSRQNFSAKLPVFITLVVIVAVCIGLVRRGEIYPLSYGFHKWSGWGTSQLAEFRWTKKEAVYFIPEEKRKKNIIIIPILASHPYLDKEPVHIKIWSRQKKLQHVSVNASSPDYLIVPYESNVIRLECNRTWIPAVVLPRSDDRRQLGIAVGPLSFMNKTDISTVPLSFFPPLIDMQTGAPLPSFEPFLLETNQRWQIEGFCGLRFILIEVYPPQSEQLTIIITHPNGIKEVKFLTRKGPLPIQVPPSKNSNAISFEIRRDFSSFEEPGTLFSGQLPVKLLFWSYFPQESLIHFQCYR